VRGEQPAEERRRIGELDSDIEEIGRAFPEIKPLDHPRNPAFAPDRPRGSGRCHLQIDERAHFKALFKAEAEAGFTDIHGIGRQPAVGLEEIDGQTERRIKPCKPAAVLNRSGSERHELYSNEAAVLPQLAPILISDIDI
jgi:hypothetical protein